LFWYFEVLEFSILFLSILGLYFFFGEVSQVRKWGMCLSSCEIWRFFILKIWNYGVFNFLFVILEV
jgi:hypothetical protein